MYIGIEKNIFTYQAFNECSAHYLKCMHLNTKFKNWVLCYEIQAVIYRVKNSKVDFTQIVPKLIFKKYDNCYNII